MSFKGFIRLSTPGRYIVESWPILLYLPRFMQWFRHEAEERRKEDTELYMSLVSEVRKRIDLGVAAPSTARRALEKQSDFGLNDVETAFALSAPFAAGVGTTLSALNVFFLAMLHFPGVMHNAQQEIDDVVGSSRIPDFDYINSLPYIKAVILETLRWRPIAPIGVPHSVIQDDIYQAGDDELFIPSGSTVYANIHSMSKDTEAFPSPDEFRPERYLEAESSSSNSPHTTFFFGFGRRICPGMHVAQNSLYAVIVRYVWIYGHVEVANEFIAID
ncbi:Cytochrome P450 monooxygenase 58 [Psilocybe cubensis]|uniref:Cytochrome P450 monooxygenase 58 n=1 Tax=Psilocybe cubensis TaxID=181762 RepID=A0ACB8H9H9_PSICU|nr:Cytochrome P450 monooxygenase 58 [Psilocybe cubensis]KAH9484581.1 Cytochrome P450 monooxygenase 58 [Psilocybe cubensis]